VHNSAVAVELDIIFREDAVGREDLCPLVVGVRLSSPWISWISMKQCKKNREEGRIKATDYRNNRPAAVQEKKHRKRVYNKRDGSKFQDTDPSPGA
jgi:hypothetical protein